MATEAGVIDELVVKLELDASDYKKQQKDIDKIVDTSKKRLEQNERESKKRDAAQTKRVKDFSSTLKNAASGIGGFAETVLGAMGPAGLAIAGVGAALATVVVGAYKVGTATAAANGSLRAMGVGAGLSTRELRAWGAAAQDVGQDARAMQESVAAFGAEQQGYAQRGIGPMMAGAARLQVDAGPGRAIGDVFGDIQKRLRADSRPQLASDKRVLLDSGYSPELVDALLSGKNIASVYAAKYANTPESDRSDDETMLSLQQRIATILDKVQLAIEHFTAAFSRWTGISDEGSSAGASAPTAGSSASGLLNPLRPSRTTAQDVMSAAIAQGMPPELAAAWAANAFAESSFGANMSGQGGAHLGWLQWDKSRSAAFTKMFGVTPDKATLDQAIQFTLRDPTESALLMNAVKGSNGTAGSLGTSFATYYEKTGQTAENARRGVLAQQIYDDYKNGGAGGGDTTSITIQQMTVQTNDPHSFSGTIQRQSGVAQSMTSANR